MKSITKLMGAFALAAFTNAVMADDTQNTSELAAAQPGQAASAPAKTVTTKGMPIIVPMPTVDGGHKDVEVVGLRYDDGSYVRMTVDGDSMEVECTSLPIILASFDQTGPNQAGHALEKALSMACEP